MGNRAVITNKDRKLGVYLHWNGGKDSVTAFLEYCRLRGFRSGGYGMARFCQVVGNYFGGGLSIGVEPYEEVKDAGDDNGVYIVENWEIVDRIFPYEGFVEQEVYDLEEMLLEIDECQPDCERLGEDFIKGEDVPVGELEVGDTVYVTGWRGWRPVKVEAMAGEGSRYPGAPFVRLWDSELCAAWDNPNNYLTDATYRRVRK